MSDNILGLIIVGGYFIVTLIIILVWIFVNPYDDLYDICGYGLVWPACLILIILFLPYKCLENMQYSRRIAKSRKKYYDEDEYKYENEDWYSEE